MDKFIKNYLILLTFVFIVMYIVFSINSASWNPIYWSDEIRYNIFSRVILTSIMTFVVYIMYKLWLHMW